MEGIELPNSIPNRDLKTRTQPMARTLTAPAAPPGLPLPEVQAPSFSFNENWQVFVPQRSTDVEATAFPVGSKEMGVLSYGP